MALTINHAVLHILDFETSSGSVFSEQELDLAAKPTKSFVQRHLRKICSSPESKHGEFEPQGTFVAELQGYLRGATGFLEFSTLVTRMLYEELRRGEGIDPCDVLVADFEGDPEPGAGSVGETGGTDGNGGAESETGGAAGGVAATRDGADEDRGKRYFALLVLPRKQSFAHDVRYEGGLTFGEVVRHCAALPNPSTKVETYLLVQADTLQIDFHDKPRMIAGSETMVVPDLLLRCTQEASSREVVDAVTRIVEDVALEYGANTAVALGKAKAFISQNAEESEYLPPWEVGDEVFADEPAMRERFEEAARREELPESVPVRRSVANRLGRTHRIRTDTGIEITFPSEYCDSPEFIEFMRDENGLISIELRNIGSIENR